MSNVLDRYDEFISVSLTDPNRIETLLGTQTQVILAIDGLQPQVGHKVLWVIRDCISESILLAGSLLSSRGQEIASINWVTRSKDYWVSNKVDYMPFLNNKSHLHSTSSARSPSPTAKRRCCGGIADNLRATHRLLLLNQTSRFSSFLGCNILDIPRPVPWTKDDQNNNLDHIHIEDLLDVRADFLFQHLQQ